MSWKQYGGVKNMEVNRKSTTTTIIADEIVLKKAYVGGFTIRGVLDVTGKAIIEGGNMDSMMSIMQSTMGDGGIQGMPDMSSIMSMLGKQ